MSLRAFDVQPLSLITTDKSECISKFRFASVSLFLSILENEYSDKSRQR